MRISPRGTKVVLKSIDKSNTTSTGIFIPSDKQSDSVGEVVALGKEKVSDLKIGDRVIYLAYSATKITNSDEELVIVDEKDILGICN